MKLPDFAFEHEAITQGLIPCGIDEAGRGPWAGPVVAAAVVLDVAHIPSGLNDSKKLTEARREALFDPIIAVARVGVGVVDAARIDDTNILAATLEAMALAVAQLSPSPTLALVDGNRLPKLFIPVRMIVGGDAKCFSIAAASIIAKVTRDRMMREMDRRFPDYGFAAHKGYGTAAHHAALQRLGPCPIHRMSFAPIAKLTISGQFDSRGVSEDS
jgi:ribonuclease HII